MTNKTWANRTLLVDALVGSQEVPYLIPQLIDVTTMEDSEITAGTWDDQSTDLYSNLHAVYSFSSQKECLQYCKTNQYENVVNQLEAKRDAYKAQIAALNNKVAQINNVLNYKMPNLSNIN